MERKKQSAEGTSSTSHNAGLPLVIRDVAATTAGGTWIYTDGSYTPQRGDHNEVCGWGFCVVPAPGGIVIDRCGPVDMSGPLAEPHETQSLSNNVGELCAILMRWAGLPASYSHL